MQSPRFIVYRIRIHSCNLVHWNVNEKSEEKKGSHISPSFQRNYIVYNAINSCKILDNKMQVIGTCFKRILSY